MAPSPPRLRPPAFATARPINSSVPASPFARNRIPLGTPEPRSPLLASAVFELASVLVCVEVAERFGDQTVIADEPVFVATDADPFAGNAVGPEQSPAVD